MNVVYKLSFINRINAKPHHIITLEVKPIALLMERILLIKMVNFIIRLRHLPNFKKLWRGSDNQRLWSNTDGVWKHD